MKKWIAALLVASMMVTPVYADTADAEDMESSPSISGGYAFVSSALIGNLQTPMVQAVRDGKTQKLDAKISAEQYEIQINDLYIENLTAYAASTATVNIPGYEEMPGEAAVDYWLYLSENKEELQSLIDWHRQKDSMMKVPAVEMPAEDSAAAEPEEIPAPEPPVVEDSKRFTDDEIMDELRTIVAPPGGGGGRTGGNEPLGYMETSISLEQVPEKLYALVSDVFIQRVEEITMPLTDLQVEKQSLVPELADVQVSQRGTEVRVDYSYKQDDISYYEKNSFYPVGIKLASGLVAMPVDSEFSEVENSYVQTMVYQLPHGETSLAGAELTGSYTRVVFYEEMCENAQVIEIDVDSSKTDSGGDFEVMNQEINSINGRVIFDTIQFNPYSIRLAYFIKDYPADAEPHLMYYVDGQEPLMVIRMKIDGKELYPSSGTGVSMGDYQIAYSIDEYLRESDTSTVEIMVLKPDKTYETFTWTSIAGQTAERSIYQ